MKEYPIPFTYEMVRAICEDRKTQTRRVLKIQPIDILPMKVPNQWCAWTVRGETIADNHGIVFRCKYGVPGDRLWVRETWAHAPHGYVYKADYKEDHGQEVVDFATGETIPLVWKSSRFMPKVAAKRWLEIVNVRIERVQDISQIDAAREGIRIPLGKYKTSMTGKEYILEFENLWNSINKKRGYGWDFNPWVWVIEFKKI